MKETKKEADIEICKTTTVNRELVDWVQEQLPDNRTITELAETFKVLNDPTRLRIVLALSMEELCVCDLATIVNTSVSAISHQLRLLKNRKLVVYRKEGKMVFYSLDDNHVVNLIKEALDHINE